MHARHRHVDGRPVHRAVRQFVVERAGDDARGGGLADAAHAGQDEGLRDAAGGEGVRNGADHRLLADQVVEAGGAVFARQHAIMLAGLRRAAEIEAALMDAVRIGREFVGMPASVIDRSAIDCLSKPACGTLLARILIAKPVPTFAEYATEQIQRMTGSPILRDSLEKTGRRLTSDPIRTSLGLLPSGPDPVGEWLVHRQSPGPYLGPKGPESKRGHRLSYPAKAGYPVNSGPSMSPQAAGHRIIRFRER